MVWLFFYEFVSTAHPVQQIFDAEEQAAKLLEEEKQRSEKTLEEERMKAKTFQEESRKKMKEEVSEKIQKKKVDIQDAFRKKSAEIDAMVSQMRTTFLSRHTEAVAKLTKSFLHSFKK